MCDVLLDENFRSTKRPLMNPPMNVKMKITRNIITVDDTAAASELSVLCGHDLGHDCGRVSADKINSKRFYDNAITLILVTTCV